MYSELIPVSEILFLLEPNNHLLRSYRLEHPSLPQMPLISSIVQQQTLYDLRHCHQVHLPEQQYKPR